MKEKRIGDLEDLRTGCLFDQLTESPCESCRAAGRSIHGLLVPPCPVKNCYSCAEVPAIDEEISAAYQHLLSLIQKRTQTIKKQHKESFIQRLPVEILSMIFLSLKEEYMEEAETCDFISWFTIPMKIPHLLVSSVCKRWRQLALNIPMLWNDIVVDLMKSGESQLWVVDEWARRSSPLPFNLTIFFAGSDDLDKEGQLEDFTDVVQKLRNLAVRWDTLALRVPWSFCHRLLDDIEEPLSIRSMFYIQDDRFQFKGYDPVNLRHPLQPRHFCTSFLEPSAIPIRWINLIHLEIIGIYVADVLNIIRNAPNLTHCVDNGRVYSSPDDALKIFPRYIVNCSVTHLEAMDNLLDHLTLPCLQSLQYNTWIVPEDMTDPFVGFIQRSCPPLKHLHFKAHRWSTEVTPCFKQLSELTHLSIQLYSHDQPTVELLRSLVDPSSNGAIILPCLQELQLRLPSLPPSSWSLVRRLFQQDVRSDTLRRPLSQVTITLYDHQIDVEMDKETLLHFLAIKNSGVSLRLEDDNGRSLLDQIAKRHDIDMMAHPACSSKPSLSYL